MNMKIGIKNNVLENVSDKLFKTNSVLGGQIQKNNNKALQLLFGNASNVSISIDSKKLVALTNEKGPGHMALEAFANQDKEVADKHKERDDLKNQLLNDNGMFTNGDKKIINDRINDINKWLDKNSSADHLINTMDNLNQYLKDNNIDLNSFDKTSKKDAVNNIISLSQDINSAYIDYKSDVDKYNQRQQQEKKSNSYETVKQLSSERTPSDIINSWANEKKTNVYKYVDLEKNTMEADSSYLKESLSNFNDKIGRKDKDINDKEQKNFYDELYEKTSSLDDAEKSYEEDYIKKAKAINDSRKENIDKIYDNIEESTENPYRISDANNISQKERINAADIVLTSNGKKNILNIDTSNINNKQNDNNSDNNQLIVPISSSDKENIVNKAEAKKNYKNILEKDRTNNALNHIFNEDAADKSVKRNIENIINEIF